MFNINFVQPSCYQLQAGAVVAKISMFMRSTTIVLVALLFCVNASAQQKAAPRLIVRGDDMGFSHSGNVALIKSSLEGIQTSIEIIVPSPWFPEAVKMLQQHPNIDVGIHIALTSEWDNVNIGLYPRVLVLLMRMDIFIPLSIVIAITQDRH